MRIIGGKLRGKRLTSPEGTKVRPTTGRIRETVFNILSSKNALTGARVLDLFCGSGALGIEALSRGAKEAVFIDKSRESIKATVQNLAACGITARGGQNEGRGLAQTTAVQKQAGKRNNTPSNEEHTLSVSDGGFAEGAADGAAELAMGDITGGAAKPVTRVYNTDFAVALRKLEGEQFDLIFLDPPYFDNLEQKCLDLIEKHSVLAANGMIVFEHHGKNDLSKHAQGYIIDTRKFGSILISFLQKEHGI